MFSNSPETLQAFLASFNEVKIAIINGDLEATKKLVDQIKKEFDSPLSSNGLILEAINAGQFEIFKYLSELRCLSMPSYSFYHGDDEILAAARVGNVEIVRWLLEKGAKWEAQDEGNTLVHLAAAGGHLELLKFLIEKGFPLPINYPNEEGQTPLVLAMTADIKEEDLLALAEYLHNAGCELTSLSSKANALFHAIIANKLEVVRWMTEKKSARLILAIFSREKKEKLLKVSPAMILYMLPYLIGDYKELATAFFSISNSNKMVFEAQLTDFWEEEIRKRVKRGEDLNALLQFYALAHLEKAYIFKLTLLLELRRFDDAKLQCEIMLDKVKEFSSATINGVHIHFSRQIFLGNFEQVEPDDPLDNDDIFLKKNPQITYAIRALYYLKGFEQSFASDLRREIHGVLSGEQNENITCSEETWMEPVRYYWMAYTLFKTKNDYVKDYPFLVKPFLEFARKETRVYTYQAAPMRMYPLYPSSPSKDDSSSFSFSEEAETFFKENNFVFKLIENIITITLASEYTASGGNKASKLALLAYHLKQSCQEKGILANLKGSQLILHSDACHALAIVLQAKGFKLDILAVRKRNFLIKNADHYQNENEEKNEKLYLK